MRRFEYTDDKSAKFWEIEQADTDLNIRWGRIGTAGQSQTKNFTDGSKAGTAMAKLITEKTSKGYAETATTADAAIGTAPAKPAPAKTTLKKADAAPKEPLQAAPAPAENPDQQIAMADDKDVPAPAVATPPWLAEGEPVRLDGKADATHAMALPTRRHPRPVAISDAQRSWQHVRSSLGVGLEPDFANTDPRLRDAFEAAWKSLDDPTLSGTPQTDAILLALGLNRVYSDENSAGERVVDYFVARHGLPCTVERLLDAMLLSVEEHYVWQKRNPVRIHYRASSTWRGYCQMPMTDGHWRLRAHLASAPQDVYDICAAKVTQAIGMLDLDRQVALAMMFPDLPEITHGVIARALENADGQLGEPKFALTLHWLQLTATDPGALAQVRKIKGGEYHNFWNDHEMVATILREHRSDAVRWLAPGAAEVRAGDALTRIGNPEAIDALARAAGSGKPALARFSLAVAHWPVAAAAALARLLVGSAKDQSLLMPALVDLVRADPTLPARLQPWLEPAANAVLDAVRTRLAGPRDVAAADELPEVLAKVPWLQPKKKSAAALHLAPLPLAPAEHWEAGEQDAVLKLNMWQMPYYQDAVRMPELMAQKLGLADDRSNPAYKASFDAARAAIAQGEPDRLLAAWRAMLSEKKKDRYHYYALDGTAVAHLPPALGIPFWNAAAAEASCSGAEFVAATWGLQALPGVLARIAAAPGENFGIALHFGAVELGPVAARAFAKLKSLRALGRAWLKRFPEHAACALIAPALGKPNEARDAAAASLRYLAGSGHLALLEQVAARYDQPEVLPALHAMLNENPLDRYPNRRPALPDFWKPDGWQRPVLHNGKALPDAALETLGTMMMFPTAEETYTGLHQVKVACTPQSLADFAWDCFSSWLAAAAPSKEVWAMLGLGVFGTDDTARKLTPFIRAWPGESAHARAVTGLDVLAAIGSDVALMLLNGIAQKVKFKGLQDKAREKILAIAEARGLSPEELEDRLAPDLGLDEQGSLLLDFGPRAYKVGFDESLKPYVREWQDGKAGARLPDLPKPKKTDDAALAAEATERFKLLKKDARTIASQQVLRLETAMCARRRWRPAVFAQFIAGHPLVRHLVRRLVWGVYAMPLDASDEGDGEEKRVASYGGTLLDCFRVAEDGEYTSAADDPFDLPEGAQIKIGLPHALELPAAQAADFGQLLADYELLQPFPQLGRDTYALDDQERSTDRLRRWEGLKVPTGKVLGLANIGWRRGPAEDGGGIVTFNKAADGGRTLELKLDPGIIVGMVDEYPEQKLEEVTLGHGLRGGWDKYATLDSFATLDPIVASELIRDLERLRS
jgi:predicted DNA-binding WGR domain protein